MAWHFCGQIFFNLGTVAALDIYGVSSALANLALGYGESLSFEQELGLLVCHFR